MIYEYFLEKYKKNTKMVKNQCCPSKGEVAETLTLVLTIIAIFVSARTVLGPIAGSNIF